jgi:hypothetical protein
MNSLPPVIVENQAAFVETLFKPINGKTADGYVLKRGKRFVDLFLAGKTFRLNKWGVFCQRDGEVWQHAVLTLGKMGWGLSAMDEVRQQFTVSRDWTGSESSFFYQ